MKKALNVLGNVLVVIILIFAIVLTTLVILSVHNEAGVPSLFGYSIMNVETDSMESENGFYTGDLIVVRSLSEEEANHLKVGDVITFKRTVGGTEFYDTHRIIPDSAEVDSEFESHKNEVIDGVWHHGLTSYYLTQGDNTPALDINPDTGEIEFTYPGAIYGIWEGTRIPKLGAAMKFLKSSTGFMICVVIPIALFFIYQLYIFIMTLTRRQKEKALEEVADKEAELKAKAVAEFLAQQQQNGGGTTPPADNTAPVGDVSPVPPTPQDAPAPETPAEPAKPADTSDVSEEEKQRIIQEYLAKQQQKKDE